jgi:hypothetical protein
MPPTILTEAIAQVGAILILAKPENRQRLPLFAGIQKVRYRRPVHPGDVMEIEATVIRLRNRMGLLKGIARVNGTRVIDGTMTFALAPPQLKLNLHNSGTGGAAPRISRAALARHSRCTDDLQLWIGGRMLETIAIILLVLWLLGMVSGYTMGNFIYVLLVIAIVLFLVRLISGRRVV